MKHLKHLLLLIPILLLASCSSDNDDTLDKQLFGTWYINKTEVKVETSKNNKAEIEQQARKDYAYKSIQFKTNGTMVVLFDDVTRRADSFEYDYEAKNGRIAMFDVMDDSTKFIQYYFNNNELTLIIDATGDYKKEGASNVEVRMSASDK